MKRFHIIAAKNTNETGKVTQEYLEKSAEERGIELVHHYVEEFDFSKQYGLGSDDGIYRISADSRAVLIEKYLINKEVKTFYIRPESCIAKLDNVIEGTLVHEKHDLPIIKTIYSLTDNTELLQNYADALGGFPLVVKVAGGMRGVGVIKVDSLDALASLTDYLVRSPDRYVLREYIEHSKHARLIVLGDTVIASHLQDASGDFRSNVGDNIKREAMKFDKALEQAAINAVKTLGFEFGGVDILFEEGTDRAVIAEVNLPCYFARNTILDGTDISGAMIDYLVAKS